MTCHPEGVQMTCHPEGVRMTCHPEGVQTCHQGVQMTYPGRGVDDILSMSDAHKI